MFSGLLFIQSSIYHIKVGVDPEVGTIIMQGSSNPIGSTVVTVNPPTVTPEEAQQPSIQPATTEQPNVTAVAETGIVNESTAIPVDTKADVDTSDLGTTKKYIVGDIVFCFIFVLYTFAYDGFKDDAITALAIIFIICRILYLVLICMKRWRTLIYQIVYVVNSIVSIGYISFFYWF